MLNHHNQEDVAPRIPSSDVSIICCALGVFFLVIETLDFFSFVSGVVGSVDVVSGVDVVIGVIGIDVVTGVDVISGVDDFLMAAVASSSRYCL